MGDKDIFSKSIAADFATFEFLVPSDTDSERTIKVELEQISPERGRGVLIQKFDLGEFDINPDNLTVAGSPVRVIAKLSAFSVATSDEKEDPNEKDPEDNHSNSEKPNAIVSEIDVFENAKIVVHFKPANDEKRIYLKAKADAGWRAAEEYIKNTTLTREEGIEVISTDATKPNELKYGSDIFVEFRSWCLDDIFIGADS